MIRSHSNGVHADDVFAAIGGSHVRELQTLNSPHQWPIGLALGFAERGYPLETELTGIQADVDALIGALKRRQGDFSREEEDAAVLAARKLTDLADSGHLPGRVPQDIARLGLSLIHI